MKQYDRLFWGDEGMRDEVCPSSLSPLLGGVSPFTTELRLAEGMKIELSLKLID